MHHKNTNWASAQKQTLIMELKLFKTLQDDQLQQMFITF